MFCQNCGSQLNEGAAFCPKCGTKVDAASGIHMQGTNENSVNQQPNQAFYTTLNPNLQEQAQYDQPIKKKRHKYKPIIIVMIVSALVYLAGTFLFKNANIPMFYDVSIFCIALAYLAKPVFVIATIWLIVKAISQKVHNKLLAIIFIVLSSVLSIVLIIIGFWLGDAIPLLMNGYDVRLSTTYMFEGGYFYTGGIENGKPDGYGRWSPLSAIGGTYEGEFVNGAITGQGIMKLPLGTVYVGELKDGEMNGQGTMIYTYGDVYTGEWKDGKYNGQGTLIYSDGRVLSGTWVDGEFQQ